MSFIFETTKKRAKKKKNQNQKLTKLTFSEAKNHHLSVMCSGILGIILVGPCLLIVVPFSFLFCKGVCCGGSKDTNTIRIVSIVTLSLFAITVVAGFASSILYCAGNEEVGNSVEELTGVYLLALLLLLFVFTLRIQNAFVGNLAQFAVSKKTMHMIYGSLFCCVLIGMIAIGYLFALPDSYDQTVLFLLFLLFVIIYFVTYIYLLRLFWVKNKHILQHKIDSTEKSSGQNDGAIIIEMRSIEVMIRYNICILVGFFSSLISWIVAVIYLLIEASEDSGRKGTTNISDAIMSVDATVNLICIGMLFEFEFTNAFYEKLCSVLSRLVRKRMAISLNSDEEKLFSET